MKPLNTISGMALLALTSIPGTASAVTSTVTFDNIDAATYGIANEAGGCDFDPCYTESGMTVATIGDPTAPNAHIHRFAPRLSTDYEVQYHQDSAGIYLRKTDESAFSLDSLTIVDLFGDTSFGNGQVIHDVFQIEAFSEAYNTDIWGATQGTGANNIGMQTITNTNIGAGNLTLDSFFSNVKAVWFHYDNTTFTPNGSENFDLRLNDLVISDVSAVPVPAAAYLFGTGLIGLVSLGRKKAAQLTA